MMCENLKQEMIELNESKDEMANAVEVLETRVTVLEEENNMLKEENVKIAKFAKGLDRELENICAYLEKQQDNE